MRMTILCSVRKKDGNDRGVNDDGITDVDLIWIEIQSDVVI
jgi:hypothetical protein